jgi:hypothetical protein
MLLAVFAAPAEAKKKGGFNPAPQPQPDGCTYYKHARECYATSYDDDYNGPTHGQPCVTEDGQPGTVYHQISESDTVYTYYDYKSGTAQTYEYPTQTTHSGPYCRPLVT